MKQERIAPFTKWKWWPGTRARLFICEGQIKEGVGGGGGVGCAAAERHQRERRLNVKPMSATMTSDHPQCTSMGPAACRECGRHASHPSLLPHLPLRLRRPNWSLCIKAEPQVRPGLADESTQTTTLYLGYWGGGWPLNTSVVLLCWGKTRICQNPSSKGVEGEGARQEKKNGGGGFTQKYQSVKKRVQHLRIRVLDQKTSLFRQHDFYNHLPQVQYD